MSRDGLRAILLGAPGSGKGTQAERLAAALGVPAISTGEMLRQAVADGSELGARVESVMAAGALVDDGLMADVVRARLGRLCAALLRQIEEGVELERTNLYLAQGSSLAVVRWEPGLPDRMSFDALGEA